MKNKYLFLLLFIWTLPLQAFVHAEGQNIVDANGERALFRGMGLGGWMVPEGYMLHTPGHGSPTAINAQIVDLIGQESTDDFWDAYRANYVTREDIHELAAWGFDHVRLPFHYKMYSPERGVWEAWGFDLTDSLIQWCSEVEMHVVLDMHAAPGGQNGGPISDSDGTARFWLEPENQAHAIEIWEALAMRYVDEPWVGGYDLLNEPVLPWGTTLQEFRGFYVNCTNVIRNIDQNHMIFIEGNWYATDFSGLEPPFDSNMSYSFHKYWSSNDIGSIQSYINMRNRHNIPLWMSESGENSNTWFHDAIQLFEENNIGWCWWTTKKVDTITSPYSVNRPAGYSQLISYWDGVGPKPNAAFSQTVLMELADNLKTENCIPRPGVVASMFSPDFNTINKPYKALTIPGSILVADYDIGAQGVSYNDLVYQTVQWDNYTAWNSGYMYRNDGVDIELSPSGIPSVGFIDVGEWMKYTIQATQGGIFSLDLEFAGASSAGRLVLYLDEELLVEIDDFPNTGGWQTWNELHIDDLAIARGSHELRLQVMESGFNLRTMTFNLETPDHQPAGPEDFQLLANYPNPFNGSTTIPMEAVYGYTPTLEILDVLGRVVYSRELEESAGLRELSYNGETTAGTHLTAGVYFYRIRGQSFAQKMLYLP